MKHIKFLLLAIVSVVGIAPIKAQQNNGKSLLWEITGNGLTKPSYLYGTIHIKDKRAFDFNDSVMPKLSHADAFAMEIILNEDNIAAVTKAAQLDSGKTLQSYFSKKDYVKLTSYLKQIGYDISLFQNYKPFALVSAITMANMKKEMPESVDELLYKKAKSADKQLLSVETVDEQIKALETMPISQIMKMVNDPTKMDKEFAEMIAAYSDYDLEKLQKLTLEEDDDDKDYTKKLLTDRNHKMAERIATMIKKQSIFVAIGAAHLPGTEGVISLLKKDGYTVNPVVAKHTEGKVYSMSDTSKKNSGPYLVKQDAFELLFPAKPETMTQKVPSDIGELQMNMLVVQGNGDNMVMALSYTDYPKEKFGDLDSAAIEKFFDGGGEGAAKRVNGKILSQQTLKMKKYPGREAIIDMGGTALIHMRNYLVGNRMYTLQAICQVEKDNNDAMKAFFTSFVIK